MSIQGIPDTLDKTAKQLGIYIDELLPWTDHINYIQKGLIIF